MRLIAWRGVPAESGVGLSISPAGGEQNLPLVEWHTHTHTSRGSSSGGGEEDELCCSLLAEGRDTFQESRHCSPAEVGGNKTQKYFVAVLRCTVDFPGICTLYFCSEHLHTKILIFNIFHWKLMMVTCVFESDQNIQILPSVIYSVLIHHIEWATVLLIGLCVANIHLRNSSLTF